MHVCIIMLMSVMLNTWCFIYCTYFQLGLEAVVKSFREPILIDTAYRKLVIHLSNVFVSVKLSTLQIALTCQSGAPKSIKLKRSIEEDILSADSHVNLMLILKKYCNWLDIQLFEIMARVCDSEVPVAIEIIKMYNNVVFSKNLREALPYFVSKYELPGKEEEKFVTAVCVKTHKNPALITIKEFIEWDWKAKDIILKDLLEEKPKVEHVREGCLEASFSISAKYDFDAYKIALHNRHHLYTVDIIHVKIGKHPLIYNPWFDNLESKFTMQYHFEG